MQKLKKKLINLSKRSIKDKSSIMGHYHYKDQFIICPSCICLKIEFGPICFPLDRQTDIFLYRAPMKIKQEDEDERHLQV